LVRRTFYYAACDTWMAAIAMKCQMLLLMGKMENKLYISNTPPCQCTNHKPSNNSLQYSTLPILFNKVIKLTYRNKNKFIGFSHKFTFICMYSFRRKTRLWGTALTRQILNIKNIWSAKNCWYSKSKHSWSRDMLGVVFFCDIGET
jgi:hypothetical protein